MPKPPKSIPAIKCPQGSFLDLTAGRCIPFKALMGERITIFQGPDCWPKSFTIDPRSNPAVTRMIVAAIQREMKGIPPAELAGMIDAEPGVRKRVRAARSVRRPR